MPPTRNTDDEDFDATFGEALESMEEDVPNVLDDDIDEPESDERADERGGDIDDSDGNRLDLDRQRAEKIQHADRLVSDWKAEMDRQTAAYRDAQTAYRKARKAVLDDGADEEREFEAQEAVMDARFALDKANSGYRDAENWQRKVQSEPELSGAQKAWVESNPRYMSDTNFQQRANRVMAKLRAEGLDDTRAPFFERVNKSLREKPRMGRDRSAPGGAPAIRTSKSDASDARANRISDGEKKFIQRLGFNPNDKRVEAQYLESRRNTREVAMRRGNAR